ncbi:MAG: hypothetical protein K5696_12850, partial [Lachnospiraceae bacterium]|nr:hypothetical protein [Lachnospiraceae bacterium]
GYLSAFARPKEITLFQWTDLYENKLVTPLGLQLTRIDRILDMAGEPDGIPAYIPYASDGENHIEDFLGMQGFALTPTPVFPEEGSVLLTASSLKDNELIDRVKALLSAGGRVFYTTGFLSGVDKEIWREFSSAYLTGRKLSVTRYYRTDDPAGYLENVKPILFADVQHSNNLSWSLLNGGAGEYHSTLFLKDTWDRGELYLINLPENPSDLAGVPVWALDAVKPAFHHGRVYVSAPNVSLFSYDNGVFILYAHVTGQAHPIRATIHVTGENAKLTWLNPRMGTKELELTGEEAYYDLQPYADRTAQVILNPGEFYAYRLTDEAGA